MSNNKLIQNVIIKHKYATPDKWAKANNYIPKAGEIILSDNNTYDKDGKIESVEAPDIYVGDGYSTIDKLMSAGGRISSDLILTEPFGIFKVGFTGSTPLNLYSTDFKSDSAYKLKTKGVRFEDLLKDAFGNDKNPSYTAPTVTISPKAKGNSNIWTYEVGSTVTITCDYTHKDNAAKSGSYLYGIYDADDTGVEWSYSTAFNGTTKNGANVTFTAVAAKDFGEDYSKTVACSASYSAATAFGKTALGNKSSVKIPAGQQTVSKTLSSYREGMFAGHLTKSESVQPSALTSSQIRGLGKKLGGAYKSGSYELTIPSGAAMVIIACPSGKTGVTKVYNDTVKTDMTTSFIKTSGIKVGGADAAGASAGNHQKDYNVWTFTPVHPYQIETKLTITLGS